MYVMWPNAISYQQWINVESRRVLLLDFGGSFNLYIPNMDPSTGDQSIYRTNTTNIEVVLKKMSNGEKLTFMRFVFPRYGRLDKGPQSAKNCIFSLSFSVIDFFPRVFPWIYIMKSCVTLFLFSSFPSSPEISAPVLDKQKVAMAVLRAGSPCVLLTPTATTQTTHQNPRQVPSGAATPAQISQQPQPSMPTIQVTPQPPQPRPVTLQNRQISQGQPMQQQQLQQAALYGTHPRGQVPTQTPVQTGSSPVSHSAISPHPHSSSGRMPIAPLNQNSQQVWIQFRPAQLFKNLYLTFLAFTHPFWSKKNPKYDPEIFYSGSQDLRWLNNLTRIHPKCPTSEA